MSEEQTTSNIKLGEWQPYQQDTIQASWVYDWNSYRVSDKGDKAIAVARLLVDSGYINLPPEVDVIDLIDLIRSEL